MKEPSPPDYPKPWGVLLFATVLALLLLLCCQDPTGPERHLQVGVLTPGDTTIFWATVEPPDSLYWYLGWTMPDSSMASLEGCEPTAGAVAVQAPELDVPMVWLARSGELRDSLHWNGGGTMFAGLWYWMTEYMRANGIPPWW